MKKILTLIGLQFILAGAVSAQCASSFTNYNLVVSNTVVLSPNSSQYISAIICSGGNLYDSLSCCTRFVHVSPGGIYQVGPQAYGTVYVKAGGTFDAHGSSSSFNVFCEAGATILNYTGTQIICNAVSFDSTACLASNILANQIPTTAIYADPSNEVLTIESSGELTGSLLSIYDLSGKAVLTYSLAETNRSQVAIASLSTGLYTYSITKNGSAGIFGKFAITR